MLINRSIEINALPFYLSVIHLGEVRNMSSVYFTPTCFFYQFYASNISFLYQYVILLE